MSSSSVSYTHLDAADQQLFQPVREPVGEKIHKPSLEQARQQGDQSGSQKDDAAASHELLHALAFGTWVVRSIALQQIDNAPHAKSSAEGLSLIHISRLRRCRWTPARTNRTGAGRSQGHRPAPEGIRHLPCRMLSGLILAYGETGFKPAMVFILSQ